MEIRAVTYAKHKAGGKRDKKSVYLHDLVHSKNSYMQINYDETIKYEMVHVKSKLVKIVSVNGKNKNSRYFLNLEKQN